MQTGRNRKPNANWFREFREARKAISDLDDCLRDLSKMARTGADALSAARAAAPLYLDLIRRAFWLFDYIDAIAFDVFEEERPFQEKMRRVTCVLQIESMATGLVAKAVDGWISCFGGKEAIAIQAIAEWIGSQRAAAGAPTDAAQIEVDRIMKIIMEKSKK
jgi:hypothetical protein